MSITWIPIDQCPEEWKDGRKILAIDAKSRTCTAFVSWSTEWGNWSEMTRNYSNTYNPTHVAEIPPELRPENIGLGKRVSVECCIDEYDDMVWDLWMSDEYTGIRIAHRHNGFWMRNARYHSLQAAIDAFEETLP